MNEFINFIVENPSIFLHTITASFIYINALLYSRIFAAKAMIMKTNNPQRIKKVIIPKELKQEPVPKRLELTHAKMVLEFIKTVRENMPASYLNNMFHNLKTLELNDNFGIALLGADGKYTPERNRIRLANKKSIYHELFHMASRSATDTRCNGLSQLIDGTWLGNGIDEGYTELLTRRYFKDKKRKPNQKEKTDSYDYQVNVCRKLEKIIGQDKMTEYYMTANFKGFIDELGKYSTEEELFRFIHSLDSITYLCNEISTFKLKTIERSIKYTTNFLIRTYFKKLKQDQIEGKITEAEAYSMFSSFIESFDKKINIAFHNYQLLRENDIFEIMSEINDENAIKR